MSITIPSKLDSPLDNNQQRESVFIIQAEEDFRRFFCKISIRALLKHWNLSETDRDFNGQDKTKRSKNTKAIN